MGIIKLMPMINNKQSEESNTMIAENKQNQKMSSFSPKKNNEYQNTVTSPILRKEKRNLKEIGKVKPTARHQKSPSKLNEIKIQPAFKQVKSLKKTNAGESESGSVVSGTKEEQFKPEGDELIFNSDEEDENSEEEEDVIKNEGYLYKYAANKLKKVWFKLVHKDLFYFKNDKDEIHKGMHNLSGVFLNEEPIKEINGKKFFSFSIQYPKKTRYYFVENESEYKV